MEDAAQRSRRGRPEDYRPCRRGGALWQEASIRKRAVDGGRREHCRLHPHSSPQKIESHTVAPDIYAGCCPTIALTISRWLSTHTNSQHLAVRTPKRRIVPSTSSANPTRFVAYNPSGFTLHALPLLRSPPSTTNPRSVNLSTKLPTLSYQGNPFRTHPYHVQGFPDATARGAHFSYPELPSIHHSSSGLPRLQGLEKHHRF